MANSTTSLQCINAAAKKNGHGPTVAQSEQKDCYFERDRKCATLPVNSALSDYHEEKKMKKSPKMTSTPKLSRSSTPCSTPGSTPVKHSHDNIVEGGGNCRPSGYEVSKSSSLAKIPPHPLPKQIKFPDDVVIDSLCQMYED
ncbi:hypothetical protein GQR58_024709 [Nymphon striatum]|nr:hypothetical protein GQR58_024709 [Nymphon striatum]